MTFVLKDEIPNKFIDDLPIKGPTTTFSDEQGHPTFLVENPGIQKFIQLHALGIHGIMHHIKEVGTTFLVLKIQLCLPEVLIVGQTCTSEGCVPGNTKIDKILNQPDLTTPKEAKAFLGLYDIVHIYIPGYSTLARPLSKLWRKDIEFIQNERWKKAFETLKKLVASAPALRSLTILQIYW